MKSEEWLGPNTGMGIPSHENGIDSWPTRQVVMDNLTPFKVEKGERFYDSEDYHQLLPAEITWQVVAGVLGVDPDEPIVTPIEENIAIKLTTVIASSLAFDNRSGISTLTPPTAGQVEEVLGAALASGNPIVYLDQLIGQTADKTS